MININPKVLIALGAVALLVAGILLGRYITPSTDTMKMAKNAERTVLYWYDPMYPLQHFDQPGPSPFMDMALVPRYADDGAGSGQASVRIGPAMVQNLGIRSAAVTSTRQQAQLDVSGLIAFNDRALTRLQTPATALVEQVWPLAEGDQVRPGQPLVRLRVPDWIGAQHEFLAILDSEDTALKRAGRDRLLSLGVPVKLISRLETRQKVIDSWTLVAPHAGVVRALNARAGMTLMAGATLTEIQSLNPVWVELAVPQNTLSQIRINDPVRVHLAGVTPPVREGRVAEILPLVDRTSRTVVVRVTLNNDAGDLRPGMSARVRIQASAPSAALAVPTQALLRTGQRTLVMLDEGDGRYRPVEVQPGAELGEQTLILSGLDEGQQIVVSGQFLLDSEASLQGIAVQALKQNSPKAPLTKAEQATLHYAEGIVEQFADGKVLLDHGPFQSLGMPAMSMRFRLADEQIATGIKEGDHVRIGVRETKSGLVVASLEKQEQTP